MTPQVYGKERDTSTILTWFMDVKTEVSQVINSISIYFMYNSWLYIITSIFAVKIFILNIHKDSYTNQNIFPPQQNEEPVEFYPKGVRRQRRQSGWHLAWPWQPEKKKQNQQPEALLSAGLRRLKAEGAGRAWSALTSRSKGFSAPTCRPAGSPVTFSSSGKAQVEGGVMLWFNLTLSG